MHWGDKREYSYQTGGKHYWVNGIFIVHMEKKSTTVRVTKIAIKVETSAKKMKSPDERQIKQHMEK